MRLKVEDVEQLTPSSTPDYALLSGTNQVSIFRNVTEMNEETIKVADHK